MAENHFKERLCLISLKRLDLLKGDGFWKSCKGVLIGPPDGTSFINVSSSIISGMLFEQSEKNVRALFLLATKLAPTIIFIVEVDK
ncbi:P-loop nucleoside triphosphate hydrolase superfamily protein, putative [Medicago truncatula]|uniref:P-loop nucleoside triphosphate hydrolase superfamily protein, putative n=1 Tax=Medicago truncatula TaxID=3880 RepID=G7J9J1_MEDTR|nr:P-loop nucleoside triphosphate hydrolase superfamily protein, putative [Medicago truncatula]